METIFFGKKIISPGTVESSNTYATELLRTEELPEGTVINAENQTKGRGQSGSAWESAPLENLTFSLILRPVFLDVSKQFFLSQCIALGISDYVSQELHKHDIIAPVLIKWPNDVLADGKKIAGVLFENAVMGNQIRTSVAGIGLNVNQDLSLAGFPATSLKMLTGKSFVTAICLADLLSSLESWYLRLRAGDHEKINRFYHERLMGMGKETRFVADEKIFSGVITGVSPSGKLKVLCGDSEKEFDIKEIRYPA